MGNEKFSIVAPLSLLKSENGEWKVAGLASTNNRDLQGEIVDQNGLDLTPLDMKKGILNWDHKRGPENTIGAIDSYKKTKEGLFLQGRLFKNHSRAKAVYEIMSSLNKSDVGRMGMSIEGVIKERAGKDGKTIKKAVIHSCALTMNPVNTDTYAGLIKSMNAVEFTEDDTFAPETENQVHVEDQPIFSANQVLGILEKALGVGAGYTKAPSDLSGGESLATSEMNSTEEEKKKKKKDRESELNVRKSLRKLDQELYKSNIMQILDNLQKLYPDCSRADIWVAVQERLRTRFPELKV